MTPPRWHATEALAYVAGTILVALVLWAVYGN